MTAITAYGSSSNQQGQGMAKDQPTSPNSSTDMDNYFITLMIAQIKNQDPTKPVDSSEFLNQFAAMSQVKSLENMASLTMSNLVLLDNLQTLTASSLVGQEVKVAADEVELEGDVVRGEVNLEHASNETTLILTDANGVKTEVKLPASEPGSLQFKIDPAELGLEPGKYKLEVKTDNGEIPQVEVAGLVTSVRVSDQGPVLEIKGIGSVPFYRITEFGHLPPVGGKPDPAQSLFN